MTGRRLKPIGGRTAAAICETETAPIFEAARAALLDSARGGNLRAIELLARGALDALSTPDDSAEPIEPHVAEAALAAACVASELGPEQTATWLETFPALPGLQIVPAKALSEGTETATAAQPATRARLATVRPPSRQDGPSAAPPCALTPSDEVFP